MFVASYRNTEAGISTRQAQIAAQRESERRRAREQWAEQQRRERAEREERERQREELARQLVQARQEATRAIAAANAVLRQMNRLAPQSHSRRRQVDHPLTIEDIMRRICRATGVSKAELLGARRSPRIVLARHAVCYWAVRRTTRSLPEIGRVLGDRDHTTILHGRDAYISKRAAMGRYLRDVR